MKTYLNTNYEPMYNFKIWLKNSQVPITILLTLKTPIWNKNVTNLDQHYVIHKFSDLRVFRSQLLAQNYEKSNGQFMLHALYPSFKSDLFLCFILFYIPLYFHSFLSDPLPLHHIRHKCVHCETCRPRCAGNYECAAPVARKYPAFSI